MNIKSFFGFLPNFDLPENKLPKPIDAKQIWKAPKPLWTKGIWQDNDLTIGFEEKVHFAIFGRCLATKSEISQTFRCAIREKDYSKITCLSGNYNVIVQNGETTKIFTDVAGLKPVFYTVCESFVAFSSLSIALQQLIETDIDPSWLGANLICDGMTELSQSSSPFKKIKAVPPGHYIEVTSSKITCKQYWHVPCENGDISATSIQLREQLVNAVNRRVKQYGRVTSDLSGGFDSTTLSLLTAKSMAANGSKLHTLTSGSKSSINSEDLEIARYAASFYPNIKSLIQKCHDFPSPENSLKEIYFSDAPDESIMFRKNFLQGMDIIGETRTQLHLNGHGADSLFILSLSSLPDLLKFRQLNNFIRYSYEYSRRGCFSPLNLIKSAINLRFTSYSDWLIQQIEKLKPKQTSLSIYDMGWSISPSPASWYTSEMINLVSQRIQQYARDAKPFAERPGQHNRVVQIHYIARRCRLLQQIAQERGVNLDFPYLDTEIINTSLHTRTDQMLTPFVKKPLLVKALYRDIPKRIFNRPATGDFTYDYLGILQQSKTQIRELFHNSLLADMGLVNLPEFFSGLDKLSVGVVETIRPFNNTIAAEVWLRNLKKNENQFWHK